MTEDEGIEILALVVAADRRTVGKADIMLWSEALKDVNHQDAADAVMHHVRSAVGEWLTPAHIIRRVREVHLQRLRDAGPVDYPSPKNRPPLTQVEERQYRILWNEQIRSGATPAQASAQTDTLLELDRGELASRPVAQALDSMFSTQVRR